MTRTLPRLPVETRAAFLVAVRATVDRVRFRHQGRNTRGLDCIGLVAYGLRECGIEGNDVRGYPKEPDGVLLRAGLVERFGEPVSDWREGDIALMRWATKEGLECHVGILGKHNGRWTLIHSYLRERRVVEHGLDGDWPKRITDVFSLTGDAP